MAEEEFHEIQLNGKQLVFLFMTGTVAAVVIFLCGLMVGRNLRVPSVEAAAVATEAAVIDPTRPEADLPPPPASTESSKPATTAEDLTYSKRLAESAPTPVDEPLQPPPTKPDKPDSVIAKTVPPPERAKPTGSAQVRPGLESEASGWTVQVQAVNSKSEADAIAGRLNAKGYPAFVTPRGTGNLVKYGIRVGKYPNKQAAEAMKTRLEREEQFKPWVTR
jgi:DedD protein